ncbi:unnamed protein product [Symbiodinium natans]|uniref:Uncharacterized protein n=1 Tax=Symbiodinium natans TaxID=878477 RepID=A0A812RW50_9DINO|nr:unnamed protein product [Symbiodinium natans]
MAPTTSEGPGEYADELSEHQSILFTEVFSGFVGETAAPPRTAPQTAPPTAPARKDAKPSKEDSKDSGAQSKSGKDANEDGKVCEWSPLLNVQRKFCKHQQRQYFVQVAPDLLKGEPFGRLRRKGYGAMMRNPPLSLPSAVSTQFGFPDTWLTSRSSCNDVARRRNLAPTVERFPALRSTGVRPPLCDLDEIDAKDEAAAWGSSTPKATDRREVREPSFKIDRPWLSGVITSAHANVFKARYRSAQCGLVAGPSTPSLGVFALVEKGGISGISFTIALETQSLPDQAGSWRLMCNVLSSGCGSMPFVQ